MNAALLYVFLATAASYQAELDRVREQQAVPGIAAVVSGGNDVWFSGASGLADIASEEALTADTPMYAGSLSKLFTAVITLHLIESDRLALDDNVTFIGASPDITIAQLLTHASGLPREGNFGYWFSADFPDRTALTRYLAETELRAPPGSAFHYSNIGYAVLGSIVIEDVLDQPFAAALQELVLEPLGLIASGSPGPVNGLSRGYTPVDKIVPSPERAFAGVGARVGNRHLREYHDARAMAPAFGIYTTANDLGRLARFLLGFGGDDILSPETRQRMLTEQPSGWGLGIKIDRINDRPVARHGGWFAAHRSHLILDLDSGVSVVVLSNSDGGNPGSVAETLLRNALQPAGTGTR